MAEQERGGLALFQSVLYKYEEKRKRRKEGRERERVLSIDLVSTKNGIYSFGCALRTRGCTLANL